ncbi:hypothetical protein ACNOYE_31105 [Nannocystaceae bacterium ST9]
MPRLATLLTLSLVSLASLACKPKGPCTGTGMVVDEREMSPVLAELGAPGKGAYCRAETQTEANLTHRHHEISDIEPAEAVELWTAHMANEGWRQITPLETLAMNLEKAHGGEDCGMFESIWAKDGVKDRVFLSVSFCSEVGWANLSIYDCTKYASADLCQ